MAPAQPSKAMEQEREGGEMSTHRAIAQQRAVSGNPLYPHVGMEDWLGKLCCVGHERGCGEALTNDYKAGPNVALLNHFVTCQLYRILVCPQAECYNYFQEPVSLRQHVMQEHLVLVEWLKENVAYGDLEPNLAAACEFEVVPLPELDTIHLVKADPITDVAARRREYMEMVRRIETGEEEGKIPLSNVILQYGEEFRRCVVNGIALDRPPLRAGARLHPVGGPAPPRKVVRFDSLQAVGSTASGGSQEVTKSPVKRPRQEERPRGPVPPPMSLGAPIGSQISQGTPEYPAIQNSAVHRAIVNAPGYTENQRKSLFSSLLCYQSAQTKAMCGQQPTPE